MLLKVKMYLLRLCRKSYQNINIASKSLCTDVNKQHGTKKFETVFTLPSIKYISIINRLKVYHLAGTSIAVPTCGALEMANIFPTHTFLTASYIGITAAALLCLTTLPFRNIIGFLYITDDNQHIKISSVDYWGKRIDRIIPVDDWIPLLAMSPKTMDNIYLTPQLADGTKYKLLLRYGKILNAKKVGQVLE